jgi:phenylacetate-CoA ligase
MPATAEEHLTRPDLERLQQERLRALLAEILPHNRFYARKFADAGLAPGSIRSLADLVRLPLTTKAELLADQEEEPPYGRVLTYPRERYSRYNQTSGTMGRPLRWLDTTASWDWMLGCWETFFRITGVTARDRLFFPFSFGPFLGFWTAFEAATRLGCLCLPGGGMSSAARLRFLLDNEATVVLVTPTYALRLAEVARQEGIDLADCPVRALIVAGEPGGSIPATRTRLEEAWGARVFDHAGATEVGPTAIECPENPGGLHLLEDKYLLEVIDPEGKPVPHGEIGEMVLTNLGRWGSPAIRYRTGDLVRVDAEPCCCGRGFVRLGGGILGRADDMIHVRGNNVYPSALEAVLRKFEEVAEYRVHVGERKHLTTLRIEVEPCIGANGSDLARRVGQAIRDELLFRPEVVPVPPGSLPRFELKARRIEHEPKGAKAS